MFVLDRGKGEFNRLIFAPIARRVKRFEAIFPKKSRSAYPLQTRKGEQGYKIQGQRGRGAEQAAWAFLSRTSADALLAPCFSAVRMPETMKMEDSG